MAFGANKALKGPTLMADLCQKRLKKYSPGQIIAMHDRIHREMRKRIKAEGGPSLPPADAYALKTQAFLSKSRELSPEPCDKAVMAEQVAYGMTGMKDGKFFFAILYHINKLEKDKNSFPFGELMVHEIAGSIACAPSKKLILQEGVADIDNQISIAAEGWANYLSSSPYDRSTLLYAEKFAPDRSIDLAAQLDIQEILQDPHFFTALALLKIETAHGWDRVVKLMHNMPGVKEVEGRIEVGNVVMAFWELYHKANQILGQRSLSYPAINNINFPL